MKDKLEKYYFNYGNTEVSYNLVLTSEIEKRIEEIIEDFQKYKEKKYKKSTTGIWYTSGDLFPHLYQINRLIQKHPDKCTKIIKIK